MSAIRLSHAVYRSMLEAAARAHPLEACGILYGKRGALERFEETANVHQDPASAFEIDPVALIAAHRAARHGGARIAGYFHSHPTGDPTPSQRDAEASAGDGAIWAIVAGGRLALWADTLSGFEAADYLVEE